jgi:hypothetical protein
VDWDRFQSIIVPRLNRLSLQTIAEALGISTAWASRIRSGVKRPHSRHVSELETLVESLVE